MGEVIKLKSRLVKSILKQIIPMNSDNERTFKLVTEAEYVRCGYLDDGTFWIDPEGGPMLTVGTVINDMTIKSIIHSYELGYIITFE